MDMEGTFYYVYLFPCHEWNTIGIAIGTSMHDHIEEAEDKDIDKFKQK